MRTRLSLVGAGWRPAERGVNPTRSATTRTPNRPTILTSTGSLLSVAAIDDFVASVVQKREVPMKADAYTKAILTVIAGCLLWLCVMQAGWPVAAQQTLTL